MPQLLAELGEMQVVAAQAEVLFHDPQPLQRSIRVGVQDPVCGGSFAGRAGEAGAGLVCRCVPMASHTELSLKFAALSVSLVG